MSSLSDRQQPRVVVGLHVEGHMHAYGIRAKHMPHMRHVCNH